MLALDSGNTAVLMLIDLSAAFDSVDHDTLLQQLQISYDLGGSVLAWLTSYLSSLIVLRMCVYLLPGRLSLQFCMVCYSVRSLDISVPLEHFRPAWSQLGC